jgi:hypothetical protein
MRPRMSAKRLKALKQQQQQIRKQFNQAVQPRKGAK